MSLAEEIVGMRRSGGDMGYDGIILGMKAALKHTTTSHDVDRNRKNNTSSTTGSSDVMIQILLLLFDHLNSKGISPEFLVSLYQKWWNNR